MAFSRANQEEAYRKIADTLEFELKQKDHQKNKEIDDLKEELSKMRVQVLKL